MGGGDRAVFCHCAAAVIIINNLYSLCIAAVHILGK